MNIKVLIGFLGVLIMIFLGCSSRTDSEMLIGNYCFNEGLNNDSLSLFPDQTYAHKFFASKGEIFEATGKWKYDSTSNAVTFEDFVFFNGEGTDGFPPGNWYSRINVTNDGEVRLIYSSENNIYYYKK